VFKFALSRERGMEYTAFMDREPKNLQAELGAKMGEVSGLLSASTADIAAIREALEFLKTSSNSAFPGTIVFDAIQKFETAIEKIEARSIHYEGQILGILDRIKHRFDSPKLSRIEIAFTAPSTSKGDVPMATQGPVTLTTAGQVTTASINGFDQFGNAWTGTIPPVTYAIDNPAFATSVPNADGLTDAVTAVANGVANLTATLTTVEGLALSDTESVTVAIPIVPPPTPVLSSIKIAFA
jgi:hypothetical protein